MVGFTQMEHVYIKNTAHEERGVLLDTAKGQAASLAGKCNLDFP
jgi:hypothetical protein